MIAAVIAYLEPGNSSMLLQVVAVAIAAAAVGIATYWRRLRGSKPSR